MRSTFPTVPLGEITSLSSTRSGGGHLPIYSVTKHDGFVPSLEYFKKQVFSRDTSNYRLVKAGQLAYATIHLDEGSIGIAPEDCLISPMYTVFSTHSNVDARYLLRFMKSPVALSNYAGLGRGAVHRRKAVSYSALSAMRVPLPPLDEQRRIAGILDAADGLRAKRRESITLLDTLTQSIFQDMFGNPEPAWQQRVVNDVAADHRGSIRTGPFGSQLLHSEFVSSGVAVLGIDNAVANEFRWAERRFITEDKYQQLRRYRVHPGDVLITIMGTTGRCAVVPNDIPLAINTKHLCCITLDRQKCLPEYLHAYFLHHRDAREYLGRQGKGAIMVGLNMGLIKAMPVTLPPIDLQAQFVNRISAAREAREAAVQAANQSDGLFASLQAHAFRGQL